MTVPFFETPEDRDAACAAWVAAGGTMMEGLLTAVRGGDRRRRVRVCEWDGQQWRPLGDH